MSYYLTQLTLIILLIGGVGTSTAAPSSFASGSADSLSGAWEASSLSSWNMTPETVQRGLIWAHAGYGQISKQFGPNSELLDAGGAAPLPTSLVALAEGLGVTLPLPEGVDGTVQGASARISGIVSIVNVHAGGAFDVLRRPTYVVAIGADIGFSQQNFQAERISMDIEDATVSIPALGVEDAPLAAVADQMGLQVPTSLPIERSIQSGFTAQSLTFFAQVEKPAASARVGYQFDLGPSPNLDLDQRESSDRQDALLFGIASRKTHQSLIIFGTADAYVTFTGRSGVHSYDAGDIYGFNAGLGYQLGVAELGAAITFRYRTDGTTLSVAGGQAYTTPVTAGHHVGVAPYISVTPAGRSFSAYVKGGVQDEYRDYTFSITGENDSAPKVGATFGIAYGL